MISDICAACPVCGKQPNETTVMCGPTGYETVLKCGRFKFTSHIVINACAATPEQAIRNAVNRWNDACREKEKELY